MLTNYLNALKNKGNFTYETISNLSGISEATVRNILSGKTEDPRFETVSAIVIAMGGSLDAVYAITKKEDVEANAVITIKETYEQRFADLKEHYEHRLAEKEKHYERLLIETEKHIATIMIDKKWFRIATCICAFALVVLFIVEILTPGLGWFRY